MAMQISPATRDGEASELAGPTAADNRGPLTTRRRAGVPTGGDNPYLALAEWLSYWMDRRYIDPILALLFPAVGDVLGAAIGLLGVFAAVKLRAHPLVIARMLLNLALDALLGSIPLLGPVADLFYRANTRNLALLSSRDVREARASDTLLVGGAALLFIAALLAPLLLLGWLLSLLAR